MLEAMPARAWRYWLAHYLLDQRELEERLAEQGGEKKGPTITAANFGRMLDVKRRRRDGDP